MQVREIQLKHVNMYCSVCIYHITMAITKIKNVFEFDLDMKEKTIRLLYEDDDYSEKEVKQMIYSALQAGATA